MGHVEWRTSGGGSWNGTPPGAGGIVARPTARTHAAPAARARSSRRAACAPERYWEDSGAFQLRTTLVSQPLLARLEPLEHVILALSAAPCHVCKRRWFWNAGYRFEVRFHGLLHNVVATLVRRDHVRRATPGCTQTRDGWRIQPQGQLACIGKRGPCCRVVNREPASQASFIAEDAVSVCRAPSCLIAHGGRQAAVPPPHLSGRKRPVASLNYFADGG
jgi:hypothetical protein